ncbi:hypothetical protein EXIGLDRAFT_768296 [Exidia glandulosa HHB12029]|uniref:Uncharacterized protein n=1 Tax=Exidia glandulosa HHB12029 TaxID=1314781 RepID=A0A165IBQ1_EXIGL|nr:hypothetical protein EXIGLDRAFT_768296 [Exidia glandulosa HHB12029]
MEPTYLDYDSAKAAAKCPHELCGQTHKLIVATIDDGPYHRTLVIKCPMFDFVVGQYEPDSGKVRCVVDLPNAQPRAQRPHVRCTARLAGCTRWADQRCKKCRTCCRMDRRGRCKVSSHKIDVRPPPPVAPDRLPAPVMRAPQPALPIQNEQPLPRRRIEVEIAFAMGDEGDKQYTAQASIEGDTFQIIGLSDAERKQLRIDKVAPGSLKMLDFETGDKRSIELDSKINLHPAIQTVVLFAIPVLLPWPPVYLSEYVDHIEQYATLLSSGVRKRRAFKDAFPFFVGPDHSFDVSNLVWEFLPHHVKTQYTTALQARRVRWEEVAEEAERRGWRPPPRPRYPELIIVID